MIGSSRPLATHIGSTSSQAGTRLPHGRVSSSARTTTAPSIRTVAALPTTSGVPPSSRGLPSGMPTPLPAAQAALRVM